MFYIYCIYIYNILHTFNVYKRIDELIAAFFPFFGLCKVKIESMKLSRPTKTYGVV